MPYKNYEDQKAQARAWYHANRDKTLARIKKWREENRERVRINNRRSAARYPEKNRIRALKRYYLDPLYYQLKRTAQRYGCLPELLLRIEFRDDYKCQHCGTEANSTFDHIVPISKGGETTFDNLQVLCGPCNFSKGDK